MAQEKKNPKSQDMIDENLKRVYEDALNEEIPDRFHALLDQLKAQDGAGRDPDEGPDEGPEEGGA